MVITEYTIKTNKIKRNYTFAMLSDLHDKHKAAQNALLYTQLTRPDAILVVGDLVDRHRKTHVEALPFLRDCVAIAPTFFAFGNHEIKYPVYNELDIASTGAHMLSNSWDIFNDDVYIGGQKPLGGTDWLRDFEDSDGFTILLDHHPEHYKEYLKDKHPEIDLILSGHAHGGQVRIKNQGIFCPGQGFLPKYTKGLYDDRLLVGTGLANTGYIVPRWGNPTEVVKINLVKGED